MKHVSIKMTPQQIAAEIVLREGGYVNDPSDPGGATNYGVTIHTMRRLGLDMNEDGVVDIADVKALTSKDAIKIFLDHYFYGPRIDMLPECLQATVFDMQVNAGSNAVKILQEVLQDIGLDVSVDGAIGPITARAAHLAADDMATNQLADIYGIARRDYYFAIADRRPASRKYARTRRGGKGGWIKRAEEFTSQKYHMTAQQFKKRVATWA